MKTTAEKIEVMQASERGETIEICSLDFPDRWDELILNAPQWDWTRCDYRVKPKPRTFWVRLEGAFTGDAVMSTLMPVGDGWIKVREVIE